MKVSMIGGGYVGLVSAVCFADLGNQVTCVENHPQKYTSLLDGVIPFYEPELTEKFQKNTDNKRLTLLPKIDESIFDSEVIILAVGTPMADNGKANLDYLFAAVDEILESARSISLSKSIVLTTKSTVPVGTGKKIKEKVSFAGLSDHIAVASNPEFLREGSAVYDFFHPDRVVIGCDQEETFEIFKRLYQPLHKDSRPIAHVSIETAELAKYASNTFLATKISFINEMAILCDKVGADIKETAKMMGMDGRIGKYFLNPSPGYGGSCFPKDTHALSYIGQENGLDLKVVNAAIKANKTQIDYCYEKIKEQLNGSCAQKRVALLGTAFKPNTDDVRESASFKLIDRLLADQATVVVTDPEAIPNTKAVYGDQISYCDTAYEAAEQADAVILMTEWNDYRGLDLNQMKSQMKSNIFIDLRLIYTPETLQKAGFDAYVLGKGYQLIQKAIHR